jgi:anthranilate synthase component 1
MQINQLPGEERFCTLAQAFNIIPVCIEILADTETPVSVLQKFYSSQHPVFLLESAEGGERWGRYSFLGVSARYHIKVYRDTIDIQGKDTMEHIPHHGDPLGVLKGFMDRFRPAHIPELPRFWGGIVGYLTYEMVSFFESIPMDYDADKPLAHFILPDELIIFDNIRHTLSCIVLAFVTDDKAPGKIYETAYNRSQDILRTINTPVTYAVKVPLKQVPRLMVLPQAESYQEIVKKVKAHIYRGDIIQAVISQPFVYETAPDAWYLYRAQRYINPSPYLFFMKLDGMTLVGSSPETMVRLENGIATLRPIAGTRPRGKTEKEDRALADELLKDEKERAEHLMLVDLGRNDLGRVAETGTVQVTDLMIIERYSHVMHMVSNICCDLKEGCDAWDLLRASYPAGTLTGAPKVRAMELIASFEKDPRGPYGGAVGYISFSGNMDLAITIRTACIENGHLTVRAGAGIVADSDPDREYQETVNKAMAIQKALELIQQNQD